jgi:hypothetical protein
MSTGRIAKTNTPRASIRNAPIVAPAARSDFFLV